MASNLLATGFAFFWLPALSTLFLGYWVYLDATIRGSDAALLWAVCCTAFLPLIIGYLLHRSEIGGRPEPADRRERILGTYLVAHVVAALIVTILPQVQLSRQLLYFGALFVGLLPGYWLVWTGGWARLRREFGWSHPSESAS